MWRRVCTVPPVLWVLAAGAVVAALLLAIGGASSLLGASAPPVEGELIAFADETKGACSGCYDIFTMRPDGSERRQITHTGRAGGPAWAPDGRHILFTQTSGFDESGAPIGDIWIMEPDGSHARSLAVGPTNDTEPAYAPSWSPDGRRIAFVGVPAHEVGGNEDLFTVRTDGTGVRRLTSTPHWAEVGPDWSPDGRRIADTGLVVVGATGAHPRNLSRGDDPDWGVATRR